VVRPRDPRRRAQPDQVVVRQEVPAPGPGGRVRVHLPVGRGHRGGQLRPDQVPAHREARGAPDLAAGARPPLADPPPAHGQSAQRRRAQVGYRSSSSGLCRRVRQVPSRLRLTLGLSLQAVLQVERERPVLRQQHGAAVRGVGGDDGAGVLARGVAVRVAHGPERPHLRLGPRLQARVLRAGRPLAQRRRRRQPVRAPPGHPHARRRRQGVQGGVGHGPLRGETAVLRRAAGVQQEVEGGGGGGRVLDRPLPEAGEERLTECRQRGNSSVGRRLDDRNIDTPNILAQRA
jgi:hypothetical protein